MVVSSPLALWDPGQSFSRRTVQKGRFPRLAFNTETVSASLIERSAPCLSLTDLAEPAMIQPVEIRVSLQSVKDSSDLDWKIVERGKNRCHGVNLFGFSL